MKHLFETKVDSTIVLATTVCQCGTWNGAIEVIDITDIPAKLHAGFDEVLADQELSRKFLERHHLLNKVKTEVLCDKCRKA